MMPNNSRALPNTIYSEIQNQIRTQISSIPVVQMQNDQRAMALRGEVEAKNREQTTGKKHKETKGGGTAEKTKGRWG